MSLGLLAALAASAVVALALEASGPKAMRAGLAAHPSIHPSGGRVPRHLVYPPPPGLDPGDIEAAKAALAHAPVGVLRCVGLASA